MNPIFLVATIILLLFVLYLVFTRQKSKGIQVSVDILIISICFLLAVAIVFVSDKNIRKYFSLPPYVASPASSSKENYSNMDTLLNSISGSGGGSGGGGTDENITKYAGGLALYYSSFIGASFPQISRRWFNVAPMNGYSISVDPNLFFSEPPSFSRSSGFLLGTNKITGPPSFQLGIAANDSFTISMLIKFDSFDSGLTTGAPVIFQESTTKASSKELLKLFANTTGNNGLSLSVDNAVAQVGVSDSFSVTFNLGFGEYTISSTTTINTSFVYLLTIVKAGSQISLSSFSNVADISSTPQQKNSLGKLIISPDTDILLSNREMRINGSSINSSNNIQCHLYTLGFWNRSLPDYVLADYFMSVQSELQKSNETLKALALQINDLTKKLTANQRCPYDDDTCKACSGVTDWSNVTNVLLNGGDECMKKIDAYCHANPSVQQCACWNPANALSKTDSCKYYKAMFHPKHAGQNNSSCDMDIDQIKSKYKLCDCVQQECAKAVAPGPKLVPRVGGPITSSSDLALDMAAYAAIKL